MSVSQQCFKHLLSPHRIGNVEIKNRFVFLPHWPGYSRDGMPTDTTINYYVERAKGGAGLIILESLAGHPKGQMSPGYVLAYDKKTIPSFSEMSKRIHDCGAKVFGQLTHAGHTMLSKPPQIMYAPTQMPEPSSRYNTKEMEIEDIKEVIHYFALSAETQREAGIDGVELKIAHDGLLRSFASPFFNQRDDEYGGNYDKRMNLFYEMMVEIRKKVGKDYPVGVRLCLDEFTPWGYSLDYGVQLAKTMQNIGMDYIDTDSGTFSSFYMEIPPMVIPLGFAIYMSAEIKRNVDIPVIAFGRINDPIQAETILAEGSADFIGMCRQLICDPLTPEKTQEGRLDDIRHCIACNDGCIFQVMGEKPLRCIQNPAAGREREFGIGTMKPATSKKKIMVIGGGVAGMKSAEILSARGHEVILYEKGEVLGGQVNLAEKLPYRIEIADVTRYLKLQLDKYNVKINLKKEVGIETVQKEEPDIVIVATGSNPYHPEIAGSADTEIRILDVRRALRHPEEIGKNVVVVDRNGHWQAAGICEYALMLGARVTCVTPNWYLGIDLEPSNNYLLHKRLFEKDIAMFVNHDLSRIEKNNIVVSHTFNFKESSIPDVDTLIVADRSVSDNALYMKLKTIHPQVYAVGDCVAPRMIEQVIFESEELARRL